jgi:hypothetical protein
MSAKEPRKRRRPANPPSLDEAKRQYRRAGIWAFALSPLPFAASFLIPPTDGFAVLILRQTAGMMVWTCVGSFVFTERLAKNLIKSHKTYRANWLFKHAPVDRKWAGQIFPDRPD